MKEKLPRPQWIVVGPVSVGIRADVSIHKKELSVFNCSVTISQIGLSLPKRFHLRSQKADSRLHGVFNRIMKPRLLILTNQLFTHNSILPKIEFEINDSPSPLPSPLPSPKRFAQAGTRGEGKIVEILQSAIRIPKSN